MQKTIQQQIDYWAAKTPHTMAYYIANDQCSVNYQQLQNNCQKYRLWFDQQDLKPQDTIAIALINSRVSVELLYACFYNGINIVTINLASGIKTKEYVINHCQAKKIFCQQKEFDELIQSKNIDTRLLVLISTNKSPLNSCDFSVQNTENNDISENDPALLMYTSGTTGNPKGVVLSHKNLLNGGNNTVLAHQLVQQDIGLCVLPLYHINAQCVSMQAALVSGSTMVYEKKFSVSTFFDTINKYQCTWVSMVPTMIVYLLKDLAKNNIFEANQSLCPSVRFIRSASAPLPVEIHEKFEKLLSIPIIETMGITEGSAQILANPLPPKQRKIGSVGIPFGNQVEIIDDQENILTDGREGEIIVKGDNILSHYFNDKENTQKAFTKNGWYRTGDLGFKDEDGYITVSGRKKELIIKGGENISPREIDEILYLLPEIVEGAAFAKEDLEYGQIVEVCVCLKENSTLDEKTIIDHCNQYLGTFKSPSRVHFVAELPKGPSGKIQRLKIVDFLQEISHN